VVRDSGGHAVGTLRAEDFQLFDNGKPQTISRFSVEKLETNESRQTRTARPDAKSREPGPESSEEPSPDRFVALLVDDVNLSPLDFIRGRNAALHYLDTLRPDERVAVYSVSGKGTLDFTEDRDRLRKTLESVNSTDPSMHYSIPIPAPNPPCHMTYYNQDRAVYQNGSVLGCPDGGTLNADDAITFAEIYHIMKTWGDNDELAYFKALRDLIAKMSTMPGRRSILLVSLGIYIPARFRQQLKDILASAVRAKVVISGVDARGVLNRGEYEASRGAPPAQRLDPNELGDQQ
jgi:VWFA-related protein